MKNFNFALFAGCCVISAGIIIAGIIVASHLPAAAQFPSNLSVTTSDSSSVFHDYMSEYEAAAFFMMNTDHFLAFVKSGALDNTYTKVQDSYIFSKDKLTQWLESRIGNK